MLKGAKVSLISNAGTPAVNDPGNYIIYLCYKYKIKVIPIPGASSAITALSISGISYDRFLYEGFLPKKIVQRTLFLKNLYFYKKITIIFNESPKRVLKTLKEIYHLYKDNCFVVIAKELTKIWESVYRGSTSEIINLFSTKKIEQKGEFIILLIIDRSIPMFIVKEIKNTINLIKEFIPKKKCIELIKFIFKIKKNIIIKFYENNNTILNN